MNNLMGSVSLTDPIRHKIIIGIDYGTTFSGELISSHIHSQTSTKPQTVGVSYVTTDKSSIDDINIISWPGERNASYTSWKTPTRIAYQRENQKTPKLSRNKWGFEVTPKLTSYSWTKLLLDKNALVGEFDDPALSEMSGQGLMKLPSFRSAEEVCEDFLHEVYQYVSLKLRHQMTDSTYDNTPMECWVTLPAIWSEEAKAATLNAAKRAGFGTRPNDTVFTIAEPEAAAIATLKQYSGHDALNPIKVLLDNVSPSSYLTEVA